MTFDLEACTFRLSARRALRFPPGAAGNVIRGALGKALRESVSAENYARIFAPAGNGAGPSGLADRPRPFVLRCAALNGRIVQPGESFCFGLHLFDAAPALETISEAFNRWAIVDSLERRQVSLDLRPRPDPVDRIRVEFLTPTELKAKGQSPIRDFSSLLARARDRISTLRSLYGAGPLDVDFRGLTERAQLVETTRRQLRNVAVQRRSGRTGECHSIGGVVGFAEYAGDLAEFVPYLEAASWTGVGRHCTWGNGHIATKIIG